MSFSMSEIYNNDPDVGVNDKKFKYLYFIPREAGKG